jgi:hypothetical protein
LHKFHTPGGGTIGAPDSSESSPMSSQGPDVDGSHDNKCDNDNSNNNINTVQDNNHDSSQIDDIHNENQMHDDSNNMQPRQVRMKKYRFIGTKRRFREALCRVPECKDISFLNSPQQIAWLKLTQAIVSLWNLGASLLHKSQALLKSTFICMHAVLEARAPTPLEIILQIAGYLHEASVLSGISPTADMLTLYTFFFRSRCAVRFSWIVVALLGDWDTSFRPVWSLCTV